jgi:LytS/YehU family sensor histidine kinase
VFEVDNNRYVDVSSNPEINGGGVGLENVQKRLDIHYPNRHTLTIRSDESTFSINLIINLES